jgi:hypothetical protein
MQAAGLWKERTQQKKPEKDRDHQDTLRVLQWLSDTKGA